MKRSEATVTYIKDLIGDREKKLSAIQEELSAIQEELRSLRHTLMLVDPPRSKKAKSDSDVPPIGTTAPEKQLSPGTTRKHFELADRLLTVAHHQNRLITTGQAYSHLLEEGLVTEQSGRFQVWHALNNTRKFKRVARGKYEAVATGGDTPSLFSPGDGDGDADGDGDGGKELRPN